MQVFLLLALILVPAPRIKQAKPVPNPIVGAWAIDWGACQQTTFFRADGTCWSPEFDGGLWESELKDDGTAIVFFGERDNRCRYVMQFSLLDLTGEGCSVPFVVGSDRTVEVKIRRGERLPAPRVVE